MMVGIDKRDCGAVFAVPTERRLRFLVHGRAFERRSAATRELQTPNQGCWSQRGILPIEDCVEGRLMQAGALP